MHYNFKLTNVVWACNWIDHKNPEPYLYAVRDDSTGTHDKTNRSLGKIPVYIREESTYAFIVNDNLQKPCKANGLGGTLNVYCDTQFSGSLIVKENMWTGWKAWRDGKRVALQGDQWLELDAPAGEHTYQFRYRPWDVLVGLALSFFGMILCGWLWFTSRDDEKFVELLHDSEE